MKTWHIQTWGAGTPHYLVSAEDEYNAWRMIEEDWKKRYDTPLVGGYESVTRGYIYQTIQDLIEIKGLTAQESILVDLNEN